jgi:hypothetical protein
MLDELSLLDEALPQPPQVAAHGAEGRRGDQAPERGDQHHAQQGTLQVLSGDATADAPAADVHGSLHSGPQGVPNPIRQVKSVPFVRHGSDLPVPLQ